MPTVLILSSHVAADAVGGSAQVVAFARAGIETIFAPTVLFGRHPGHGAPGGGAVEAATFEGVLTGIAANGAFDTLDAVVTGYFADAEQVAAATRTIDAVRAVNQRARIIVDPIMGDHGKGLYVKAAVADALAADLVSRADLLAPNAWELQRLTGLTVGDPTTAVTAARGQGRAVLVSSVDVGPEIGVVYADADEAWMASHRRADNVPHGTGDLLTALFTADLLQGASAAEALQTAVSDIARRISKAPVTITRLA